MEEIVNNEADINNINTVNNTNNANNANSAKRVYLTAHVLRAKYDVSRMSLYIWKLQGILTPKINTENGRCTYLYDEEELKDILRIKNWKENKGSRGSKGSKGCKK